MPTVEFVLPSMPVQRWTEFEKAYPVPESEVTLMNASAEAGRRGHLEVDEFRRLASWKSHRPKTRHELNSDAMVREITGAAFQSVNDVEKIVLLTHLSGVNVRIASAILHLCFPTRYPLLDVRAMAALGIDDDHLKTWDELQRLRVWSPYIVVCRQLSSMLGWNDLRRTDRAPLGERPGRIA